MHGLAFWQITRGRQKLLLDKLPPPTPIIPISHTLYFSNLLELFLFPAVCFPGGGGLIIFCASPLHENTRALHTSGARSRDAFVMRCSVSRERTASFVRKSGEVSLFFFCKSPSPQRCCQSVRRRGFRAGCRGHLRERVAAASSRCSWACMKDAAYRLKWGQSPAKSHTHNSHLPHCWDTQ